MNRRLNWPLVLTLVIGTPLFGATVYGIHEYQQYRNAGSLLNRAAKAEEDGDKAEAFRLTRRYLIHRQDDTTTLKQLAIDMKEFYDDFRTDPNVNEEVDIFQFGQKMRATLDLAVRRVDPVSERTPEVIDLDRRVLRTYIDFQMKYAGDWPTAKEIIVKLGQETEHTPEDKINLAICEQRLNKTEEAKRILFELIGYDIGAGSFDMEKASSPETLECYTMAAGLAKLDGEDELAMKMVNQMVDANPESAQAKLARARYFNSLPTQLTGGTDYGELARNDIKAAVQHAPGDIKVVLSAVEDYLKLQEFDQAKALLDNVAEEHRNSVDMYMALANVEYRSKQLDAAYSHLKDGLKEHPKDRRLTWFKANVVLELEDQAAFDQALKELREVNYRPLLIQYLEGRNEVAKGDFSVAVQRLETLRPLIPSFEGQIDHLLLICYSNLKYWPQVLLICDRLIERDASNRFASEQRLEALKRLGRDEYKDVVESQLADADIEEVLAETGGINKALRQLQVLIDAQNRKPVEQRRWLEVDKLAKTLLRSDALTKDRKVVLQAQVLINKGESERALDFVNKALTLEEYNSQRALWHLKLGLTASDPNEQRATFAEMKKLFGDDASIRLIEADFIVRNRGADTVDQLKSLETNVDNFTTAQQAEFFDKLAPFYIRARSDQDAKRVWEKVAELNPKQMRVRLALFDLAYRSDDEEGMVTALGGIESVAGKTDEWRLARATYIIWQVKQGMVDRSELTKAVDLLGQAKERRPDWPQLLMVEAEVAMIRGDDDAALESLQKARRVQPNNMQLTRAIIRILSRQGREEEAREVLEEIDPRQVGALDPFSLAKVKEKNGDIPGAIAALETAVSLESNSPANLVEYGRLLAMSPDRLEDAEMALRRALMLDPTIQDYWLPLIRFLADEKVGKKDEAEALIREAQKTLSQRQLTTVLGKCYQAANMPEEAEEAYRVAYFSAPNSIELQRELAAVYIKNRRLPEAEEILKRMVVDTRDDRSATDNKRWARRELARQLANKGGFREFEEARNLLEENKLADGSLSEDDAMAYVMISATRPDNESRLRAVKRVTDIEESGKRDLTSNEIFLLAQTHEKLDKTGAGENHWREADRLIKRLVQNGEGGNRVLERYITWLIERDKIGDAETWRTNLPRNSTVRIKADAQIYLKRGNSRLAREEVLKLKPKTAQDLREMAEFREKLGEDDPEILAEAESMMRRLAEKVPSQRLALAAFLGRRDDTRKINEAINICYKALTDDKLRGEALDVAVTILRVHYKKFPPESKQFQFVAKWFPLLKKKYQDAPELYMPLAELETQRGNTKAVINTYREFLERDDLSDKYRAVIKNNLSFALAVDGDTTEALNLINDAIDYLGPTGDLLDTRAMAYIAASRPDNAIQDMQNSINQIGESGERLFHLALAQEMKGQRDVATELMQRANELGLEEEKLPIQQRPLYRKLLNSLGLKNQLSRS